MCKRALSLTLERRRRRCHQLRIETETEIELRTRAKSSSFTWPKLNWQLYRTFELAREKLQKVPKTFSGWVQHLIRWKFVKKVASVQLGTLSRDKSLETKKWQNKDISKRDFSNYCWLNVENLRWIP